MQRFQDSAPSPESYWRAIVLFGRNSASYKFALAKSLLELCTEQRTFTTLEDLAKPFAAYVCEHLKIVDRQGNRPTGAFLDACRKFNQGEIGIENLRDITVARGFQNVIDAFHIVEQGEVPVRFFVDERSTKQGIAITDALLSFKNSAQFENLNPEVEARWRLVETAWDLRLSRSLVEINADPDADSLFVARSDRRPSITSCRSALDGYQKGKCFYCFRDISIDAYSMHLADVDHFFPRKLFAEIVPFGNIDGVWNLVLACRSCNRGSDGKFGRLPSLALLERLYTRNTYLIQSHHPLRETLMLQMGSTDRARIEFLQRIDSIAKRNLVHRWDSKEVDEGVF